MDKEYHGVNINIGLGAYLPPAFLELHGIVEFSAVQGFNIVEVIGFEVMDFIIEQLIKSYQGSEACERE